MTLDAVLTTAAVSAAGLWLLRRVWLALRARRDRHGCAGGCGCATTKLGPRR